MKLVSVLTKVVSFLLINLFLICDCLPDPRGGGGHGGGFGGGHAAGVGHGGFGHGGFGHGGFGHGGFGHGGFGHGGFGHGPYGGGGFIIPPSYFQRRHRNYRTQRIGAFGFGLGI